MDLQVSQCRRGLRQGVPRFQTDLDLPGALTAGVLTAAAALMPGALGSPQAQTFPGDPDRHLAAALLRYVKVKGFSDM